MYKIKYHAQGHSVAVQATGFERDLEDQLINTLQNAEFKNCKGCVKG